MARPWKCIRREKLRLALRSVRTPAGEFFRIYGSVGNGIVADVPRVVNHIRRSLYERTRGSIIYTQMDNQLVAELLQGKR